MRTEIEARSRLLSDQEPKAIGCVEDGLFLVYVAKVGFKLLDARKASMEDFMSFKGSISSGFGIFPYQDYVSFAEAPAKSFVTYRRHQAEPVGRMVLPSPVAAACAAGPGLAALALENGLLRFAELSTGKATGKGTTLRWVERSCPETFVEPLAAGRVVVMRQLLETTKIHYYVVDLEDQAAHVSSSGVLRLPASGSLRRVCASGDGRLLLQLREAMTNGSSEKSNESFVLVNLSRRHKVLASWSRKGSHLLQCLGDYFAECSASALCLRLLTCKSCLHVAGASKELPTSHQGNQVLLAASEHYTAAAMGSTYLCTRWLAPPFALSKVLARGVAKKAERPSVKPEAKRLARLMRELRDCSEELARERLKEQLRSEDLEQVLKLMLSWLGFRRDLPRGTVADAAPRLPSVPQIVHFLQLLADVFSLSLMKLPTDVLQKVVERLADCQKEASCNEQLYARCGSSCCERPAKRPKFSLGPVELVLLDF